VPIEDETLRASGRTLSSRYSRQRPQNSLKTPLHIPLPRGSRGAAGCRGSPPTCLPPGRGDPFHIGGNHIQVADAGPHQPGLSLIASVAFLRPALISSSETILVSFIFSSLGQVLFVHISSRIVSVSVFVVVCVHLSRPLLRRWASTLMRSAEPLPVSCVFFTLFSPFGNKVTTVFAWMLLLQG